MGLDAWVLLPAWWSIVSCAVGPQHGRGPLCSLPIPSLIPLLSLCLCAFPWCEMLCRPWRDGPRVLVWAPAVVHLQVLPPCFASLGALLSPSKPLCKVL